MVFLFWLVPTNCSSPHSNLKILFWCLFDFSAITPNMEFTKLSKIELPAGFDAHVHLRDGEMSQLVTPTIRNGGVNQVYVMVS
jgi:hypothetical protein